MLKQYEFCGFGFPILLLNVPLREARGEMILDVNYNALGKVVLEWLAHKSSPFTGKEIQFIRQSFDMTLPEFAKLLGVTHPAVIKWENARNRLAKINPHLEFFIRLCILEFLKANKQEYINVFEQFKQNDNLKKPDRIETVAAKPCKIEMRRMHC